MQTTKTQISCTAPLRYYNLVSFFIRNFTPLASFYGCTAMFVPDLVKNPDKNLNPDNYGNPDNIKLLINIYHQFNTDLLEA